MCSESETSPPRLSFSHDFICQESDPVESGRGSCSLASNSDFEFSFIIDNEEQQSSSADDLFCDRLIVPIESRNKIKFCEQPRLEKTSFSENSSAIAESSELAQKQRSKSFWGFKRSSSLHYESERSRVSSISLLSRSNSTGSNQNQNHKRINSKEITKKISTQPLFHSSSSKSFGQRKIHKGFYGNYPWINPVLNIPPPHVSRGTTASLFGFGSCLRHGKEKQSKK